MKELDFIPNLELKPMNTLLEDAFNQVWEIDSQTKQRTRIDLAKMRRYLSFETRIRVRKTKNNILEELEFVVPMTQCKREWFSGI